MSHILVSLHISQKWNLGYVTDELYSELILYHRINPDMKHERSTQICSRVSIFVSSRIWNWIFIGWLFHSRLCNYRCRLPYGWAYWLLPFSSEVLLFPLQDAPASSPPCNQYLGYTECASYALSVRVTSISMTNVESKCKEKKVKFASVLNKVQH